MQAYIAEDTTESMDRTTELLWHDALRHLPATNNEVLLPTNIMEIVGEHNVNKIKNLLS